MPDGPERHGVRTFDVSAITRDDVLAAKQGRTISLCIPCRDEAATVGSLVSSARTELMGPEPVIDELIVLDDRSSDDTARVAAHAGARVVPIQEVHARHGDGHGKGNALWATLLVSEGDVVVWCDGDVTTFEPWWVHRLVWPLLTDSTAAIVKAMYRRPSQQGDGGGRTTELVARPMMSLYFPELTGLAQPLAGEFAGRRDVLESLSFVQGWGTEIAMLIDVSQELGASSIAQVDLGERVHRNRPLHSLSVQAAEVLAVMLQRAGVRPDAGFASDAVSDDHALRRADGSIVPLNLEIRPPAGQVSHK